MKKTLISAAVAAGTLAGAASAGDIDTVFGLFHCNEGEPGSDLSRPCEVGEGQLIAVDNDSNGLLSRLEVLLPLNGTYVLAVTFCCDDDYDGVDPGQGEPFDHGRYVLDAFVLNGTPLALTDESTIEYPLDFDFPFQGATYSSVWVNSNGYLTFGAGETDQFIPNISDFENGLPRIAPLWVDLNPSAGGVVLARGDSASATFSYSDVPEFFSVGSNTYSVTIHASGEFSFSFNGVTATKGITGVAEGGGAIGI